MVESVERESRQYDLMRDRLSGYREGTVSLRRLVDDLEALLGQLEFTRKSWIEEFRDEVNKVEEVYAVALGEGTLDNMSRKSVEVIDEAVRRMDRLLTTVTFED